ncbi:MAG: hypothetical protein KDA65_11585 [Planctomycetaceae bacterium]|nr:hypothetical protein [Planctomycetaceae bacterium]
MQSEESFDDEKTYPLNKRLDLDKIEVPGDVRLYVHEPDSWQAVVKQGYEKEYCYAKSPGEDHFHLLMAGEIYVRRGNEKYCLTCAYRHGILSHDRLHWQHRKRS